MVRKLFYRTFTVKLSFRRNSGEFFQRFVLQNGNSENYFPEIPPPPPHPPPPRTKNGGKQKHTHKKQKQRRKPKTTTTNIFFSEFSEFMFWNFRPGEKYPEFPGFVVGSKIILLKMYSQTEFPEKFRRKCPEKFRRNNFRTK